MVVFLSQLNDLEIWGADVGNAYLEAYTHEELCIIAGPDFKELQGHLIQFPPEMDENWVRYGLAKLGQISRTKLAEDAVLCVHNTASALNR